MISYMNEDLCFKFISPCILLYTSFSSHSFLFFSQVHDPRFSDWNIVLSKIFSKSWNWKLNGKTRHSRDNEWLRDFLKYHLEVIDEKILAWIYSRVREVQSSREGIFSDHKFLKYACNRKTRLKIFTRTGSPTSWQRTFNPILFLCGILHWKFSERMSRMSMQRHQAYLHF